MKRLLMIAYDFPPMLPGVRRTLAFIRHLPQCGWRPEVVTVKPVHCWAYDASPLKELEDLKIAVHRCGSRDPYRLAYVLKRRKKFAPGVPPSGAGRSGAGMLAWLRRHWFCPDDRIGWVQPAIAQGRRMIAAQPPDAIWTTSFPHSTHLVGLALKREFPGIPWIADFRDGWTQNADFFAQLAPRLRRKSAAQERRTALAADAITAVSQPIADHFRALAGPTAKPIVTLPNGFDETDMRNAPARDWEGFSLVYCGTLFGERTAEPLFAAAAEAITRRPELRGRLRLVFVGSFGAALRASAKRHGVDGHLVLPGAMPYLESLGAQKGASVLVALVGEAPHIEIMLTQKVFEYLGSGRPILALAPERSALARLVHELDAGHVCDPASPSAGAQAILALHDRLIAGQWTAVPAERLAPYTRRHQTRRLASILDSMVAPDAKKA